MAFELTHCGHLAPGVWKHCRSAPLGGSPPRMFSRRQSGGSPLACQYATKALINGSCDDGQAMLQGIRHDKCGIPIAESPSGNGWHKLRFLKHRTSGVLFKKQLTMSIRRDRVIFHEAIRMVWDIECPP